MNTENLSSATTPIAAAISAAAPTLPGDAITLGPVVVQYPNLVKARKSTLGGEDRFSATVTFEKTNTEEEARVRAAIRQAFAAKFGSDAKLQRDKQPLRDGDVPTTEDPDDHGKYPGCLSMPVSAYTDNPPVVKNIDGSLMTDPKAMRSGDWIYVVVKPRAYGFENSRGVAMDILGARLVKKGVPPKPSGAASRAAKAAKAAVGELLDSLDIPADAADEIVF
jgi:hypothetical protein